MSNLTGAQKRNAERNRRYWAKREDEALKQYIKSEKEYDAEIQRIYSNMLDSCTEQINAFYGRYADKEGITLAEAKKRVRQLDIEEYERKAKRYVKDKDFSAKANEEMRLYNATMKINRLEMLKANIGLEMIAGHDELDKFMGGILKGRTEEELVRQAGILGKTIQNNSQLAHAIPNASFHNATFSDRIWLYQDLLKAELDKLLQSGLIQGKNPRVLARELKNKFNTSTSNAERLMRTELARVQTEAQKQSFEKNGFEEYEFIANANCCDICQSLNGKHFKVAKMMPGENAAPMHPYCRCSTAPYSDRKEYDEWLDFLEKGGTTEEYNKLKAKGVPLLSMLTNNKKNGKISSGAISGAYTNENDPDGIKRDEHAELYYKSMRKRNETVIASNIAAYTGIDKETVLKMYKHLFINKYDLDKGHTNFDPDYNIAESIRRLQEGKNITEHDLILVKHEAMEYDLMNNANMKYEEAHEIANKSYNYTEALYKWLDKKQGGD